MEQSDPVHKMILLHKNKFAVLMVASAFAVTPVFTNATDLGSSIIGNNCLVPVYHTDFAFPPEGGKIIRTGDQMYFVQDYRPECAGAGTNAQVIAQTSTPTEPKIAPGCQVQ